MGLESAIMDPKSRIGKKPIPDPGVKKAPDPGSATLVSVNLKRSRPKIIEKQDLCRWFRFAQLAKGKKFRP
jgi:hypothetical protein